MLHRAKYPPTCCSSGYRVFRHDCGSQIVLEHAIVNYHITIKFDYYVLGSVRLVMYCHIFGYYILPLVVLAALHNPFRTYVAEYIRGWHASRESAQAQEARYSQPKTTVRSQVSASGFKLSNN